MSETVQQSLKLKIVKPVNISWNEFSTLINQKAHIAAQFANKLLQEKYIQLKSDFEIEKSPHEYRKYRDELSSYVRDSINQQVQKSLSGKVGKGLLRGDSTLPTFKPKNALFLRGQKTEDRRYQGFDFYEKDGDFFAELKIRPGRPKERPIVLLATRNIKEDSEGYYKIIKRVANNHWRSAQCQVLREDHDIYLSIVYEKPVKEHKLDSEKIMGVDIGVRTICATFNNDLARRYFRTRTDNIIRRKAEIQKQRKQIKKNIDLRDRRRGHGRKSKYTPLREISEKWNNFRKTSNHELSKAVVKYALKKRAGNIQLEDLTDGTKDKSNTFIGSDWPVAELLNQIEYKAEDHGINTKRINPRYTSRRCPSCGYINMYFSFDYRKKNDFPAFECKECGFRQNADFVGARNVAEPNIEEKIKKQVEKQKEEKQKKEEALEEALV